MKINIDRKTLERIIYILIIIGLAIYGTKDSEAAVKLIKAIQEAFTILSI